MPRAFTILGFTPAEIVKFIGVIMLAAMAWGSATSRISALEKRADQQDTVAIHNTGKLDRIAEDVAYIKGKIEKSDANKNFR